MISCLMVALPKPERLAFFKRSVAAYCAQSYARKELVIVTDGSHEAQRPLAEHVAALGRDDIRFVPFGGTLSLGALRNRSCEAARGELVCQWDDDDLYHPERLEEQLRAMDAAGADCSYLEDVMQFVPASRSLFWTNWRATDLHVHPGTLLGKRAVQPSYPESGEIAERGEDSIVCRELQQRSAFTALAGKPYLYVYVSHGANKHSAGHHDMLASQLAISRGLLLRREQALRAGLAAYDFGPEEIAVQGSNGTAFTLMPTRSS